MKDIRLLGDLVRVKLREMGIPVVPYILAENVLCIALAAHFSFYLPFSDASQSFVPLMVILIGVIYGMKSGLIGILAYIVCVLAGFPVVGSESAGLFTSEAFLLGFVPAVLVGGLSANFEWDRDMRRSAYFILFAQLAMVGTAMLWWHLMGPQKSAYDVLLRLAPGIALNTFVGVMLLKMIWGAVLNLKTDEESAGL